MSWFANDGRDSGVWDFSAQTRKFPGKSGRADYPDGCSDGDEAICFMIAATSKLLGLEGVVFVITSKSLSSWGLWNGHQVHAWRATVRSSRCLRWAGERSNKGDVVECDFLECLVHRQEVPASSALLLSGPCLGCALFVEHTKVNSG